jgi:RNA polymerase sigma factor (sigma-70 family)
MQRTAMAVTDRDLVTKATSGDADAFAALVRRYRGAVHGLAYNVAGDFDEAEDIAQEAFVSAYLNLARLSEPDRFAPWIRQITHNCGMMAMRRQKAHLPLEGPEAESVAGPPSQAEETEREEARRMVHRGLQGISDRNRLVMSLYFLGGMSYKEIARFLDVPVTTIEGRMHRARKQLRGTVMSMIENSLQDERLSEDFVRRTLEAALEGAKDARRQWSREEFLHSCREALTAAAKLDDVGAQVELYSMLGDAESTWLGASGKAIEDYALGLSLARGTGDIQEQLRMLKGLYLAYLRLGKNKDAGEHAEEARELCKTLENWEDESQAAAAQDLAAGLSDAWEPGVPGGYALAALPIRADENGVTFLDPAGVHNYTWGCPSRCTALAHLLRPRRLLGPALEAGAAWEDQMDSGEKDGLSWGLPGGHRLAARATVESLSDRVVTAAGDFTQCLKVVTVISPLDGGMATVHSVRSFCGTRTAWFADGVGLVKLRHEDQNGQGWLVSLVDRAGTDGSGFFPLGADRMWRYRWLEAWRPCNVFEDTCRVTRTVDGISYISSATWASELGQEEALGRLDKALEMELAAGDETSEAALLEMVARTLGEDEEDRLTDLYRRLVCIYEAAGPEWNLNLMEARRRLNSLEGSLSPSEEARYYEEKADVADRSGDASRQVHALRALANHHRERGDYGKAADILETAAVSTAQTGDARAAADLVASAEWCREMTSVPPGASVHYVSGVAHIVSCEGAQLESKGSWRGTVGNNRPEPAGTPMADFFWNGPLDGMRLLPQDVGSSTTESSGTSAIQGKLSEVMKATSTLVSRSESVEVPAGEYSECALIETIISASSEDRGFEPEVKRLRGYYAGTKKVWFAPGVGVVRLMYHHSNGQETDIQLTDCVLSQAGDDYLPLAIDTRWRYEWREPDSQRQIQDLWRVASRTESEWNIAFVTRTTAAEG